MLKDSPARLSFFIPSGILARSSLRSRFGGVSQAGTVVLLFLSLRAPHSGAWQSYSDVIKKDCSRLPLPCLPVGRQTKYGGQVVSDHGYFLAMTQWNFCANLFSYLPWYIFFQLFQGGILET
jgi:hypothetical protein